MQETKDSEEEQQQAIVAEICRECPAAAGPAVSRGDNPEYCGLDFEVIREEYRNRFLGPIPVPSGCPKKHSGFL